MSMNKPPLGTPKIPGHPQLRGLVFWSLGLEGAGGIVSDLSGNWPPGVMYFFDFPPTALSGWGPGKFGKTLTYDGANDVLHYANAVVPDYPFTITAWFNVRNTADFHTIISLSDATDADRQIAVLADGGALAADKVIAVARNDSIFAFAESATTFTANKWYFVAAVFASATSRDVYLNAAGKGSNATSRAFPPINVLDIGRLGDSSPSSWLAGQIDDVRVYNRALTLPELQKIMRHPFAVFETLDLAILAQLAVAGVAPTGVFYGPLVGPLGGPI